MRNNQGFTLIELIVVIIIIGILAGGAAMGIHSLDSGNAQSSVKRINALIDYVQVQNMSKDKSYYLVIEEESGAYVAKVQYDVAGTRKDILTEKLKLKNGNITYYNKLSADPAESEITYTIDSEVSPAVSLEISFVKDSGALQIGSDGRYVKRIVVNAANRTFTIYLVAATGKHYIEG
ncbi:MAG: prepilin-type N-terminal cleavage/methylation domain-containing protein [Herbinix sp.]|nr:prepilin-type N-terminal cleavage/methylation domain-containing protein [Herbinix sp.]